MLEDLSQRLAAGDELENITEEQLLQGPFSDAMTHAGQLAMLRRLHREPVAPENFIFANVSTSNLTSNQPEPASPDTEWPDRPMLELAKQRPDQSDSPTNKHDPKDIEF
ncbi:MAG: hypothetical protein IPG58_09865 [Acidobacteria bacterium]|nr:hypothetical protein [Acidobacteriota bacterium]